MGRSTTPVLGAGPVRAVEAEREDSGARGTHTRSKRPTRRLRECRRLLLRGIGLRFRRFGGLL
ncbi:hypothetical protein Pd630_LPD03991 [Rhodococcus opacus PD630]|nr:hypothetical protein Pd630_LPD03991 [Rhodococcus opacus PD630]